MESHLEASQKAGSSQPHDTAPPLLGIYPKDSVMGYLKRKLPKKLYGVLFHRWRGCPKQKNREQPSPPVCLNQLSQTLNTSVFIIAPFTTGKIWNQPGSPSQWMDGENAAGMHIKKNKVMSFAGTWM